MPLSPGSAPGAGKSAGTEAGLLAAEAWSWQGPPVALLPAWSFLGQLQVEAGNFGQLLAQVESFGRQLARLGSLGQLGGVAIVVLTSVWLSCSSSSLVQQQSKLERLCLSSFFLDDIKLCLIKCCCKIAYNSNCGTTWLGHAIAKRKQSFYHALPK